MHNLRNTHLWSRRFGFRATPELFFFPATGAIKKMLPLSLRSGARIREIVRVPPQIAGINYGYYMDGNTVVFVLYPRLYSGHYVAPDAEVFVAGNFNGWKDAVGNPAWRLRRVVSGQYDIWELRVPQENVFYGDHTEKVSFKFVTKAGEWLVRSGSYEDFLTATAQAKYNEFERAINESEEFLRDWEMLKTLYPDYKKLGSEFVLHRRQVHERGWTRGAGTPFNSLEDGFRAAFDLFCWKYYLWGMDLVKDLPLLLKPSVNVTPYGTQIFIPAYMSYDARRDFNHAKIAKLHRAKGVRRQGVAFSEARIENKNLAKRAQKLYAEGRGMRGNALPDFVDERIRRPEIDIRTLRRLLKKEPLL